jgi:hypothetical protein
VCPAAGVDLKPYVQCELTRLVVGCLVVMREMVRREIGMRNSDVFVDNNFPTR